MQRLIKWLFAIVLLFPWQSWGQDSVPCPYRFSIADQDNFEKGVAAFKNRHYSEANTILKKVSSKNPKAADPYFYLGMIAVKADQNPGAIRRYFTKLRSVCPDYPDALAHFYMAVVLYTDEQYEEAVGELNRYFEMTNQTSNADWISVYEEASNYLYWSQFLEEAYRDQKPFIPYLMAGVSSKEDELLPYITPDGKEIYYLRKVSTESEQTFYGRELEHKEFRLCKSVWKDTAFSFGEQLGAPFNLHGNEGGITMTADKKALYYSILTQEKGYQNCDLYMSHFQDGAWSDVAPASQNINGKNSWESQPTISPDGQYLYFASNRAGGLGGTDIWFCHRLPNGDWSRAENMGAAVNTSGNEKSPFLCADGHTLYFASNGWQGFGGYDMYYINLSDPYMQLPINLGLPINSESDDICFGVMSDGKRAYFAGKGTQLSGIGGSDIFWFELYPDARPEAMYPCSGKWSATSGTIQVFRTGSMPSEYWIKEDGEFTIMLSSQEDNLVAFLSENSFPLIKKIPRKNHSYRLDNVALKPLALATSYPIETDAKALDIYAQFLINHPKIHLRITASSNDKVEQIRDHFLQKGLRAERMEIKISPSSTPFITLTKM